MRRSRVKNWHTFAISNINLLRSCVRFWTLKIGIRVGYVITSARVNKPRWRRCIGTGNHSWKRRVTNEIWIHTPRTIKCLMPKVLTNLAGNFLTGGVEVGATTTIVPLIALANGILLKIVGSKSALTLKIYRVWERASTLNIVAIQTTALGKRKIGVMWHHKSLKSRYWKNTRRRMEGLK